MTLHKKNLTTLFFASRPQFLTASIMPVLVGSALGFAIAGTFNWPLFLLALFGMMFLHAGANIANDYFDHISNNDWLNTNVTPFSGGSRFIQNRLLSPKAMLLASLFCLTVGAIFGIVILMITQSIFILAIGLVGILGSFFYTAPPVKLGYRGIGEVIIGFLFGVLPVYGSYYLQTRSIDIIPLSAGCVVGIMVFLIILANEFPDLAADAAVNKKTLIVRFGVGTGVLIYRIAVISTFVIALAGAFINRVMAPPFMLYFLFGLPAAAAAMSFVNISNVSTPGRTQHRACAITIILHLIAALTISVGVLGWTFVHRY